MITPLIDQCNQWSFEGTFINLYQKYKLIQIGIILSWNDNKSTKGGIRMIAIKPFELRMAMVTQNGILLEGIAYSHSRLIRYGWFERAKMQGRWQIPVLSKSSDLSRIVLFDTSRGELLVAVRVEHPASEEGERETYFLAFNELKKRYYQAKKRYQHE
jgi:hypothetical protein